MNIFYLDKDAEIAAQYHCDKHCVKMILESAQLLSTAHRVLDGDEDADRLGLYKSFSPNHPSAIWVRQSDQNYNWLWELLHYLGIEYSKRYDKVHSIVVFVSGLVSRPQIYRKLFSPLRLSACLISIR